MKLIVEYNDDTIYTLELTKGEYDEYWAIATSPFAAFQEFFGSYSAAEDRMLAIYSVFNAYVHGVKKVILED